ncbi:hypothetical protein V6N11_057296 [Hibiscus sabdariffa]|uniref:NAC domain-containing protein n=1 Tax=Hibiscus sabdariffa TaxID=183260 RepID=A0ABR2NKV1_9ROSI
MNQASIPMASANSREEGEAALFRSLPSGYRFKPKDEELVDFYLKRKILNKKLPPNIIRDVDLYNYDPDTLIAMNNNVSSNGVVMEWYFFTPRERKYANGVRPRRCAGRGFWKASGKDTEVFLKGEKIGLKKTLVYYKGKPPKGDKTDWTMHEYVLIKAPARQRLGKEDMRLDDWVLCRVYKRLIKRQKSSGKDAPLADQNKEFDADSSDMPMSQQTVLMPLSSVGPSNRSHFPSMQQQQFLNACPSNQLHMPLTQMQQQQFSNVGPSNQPHLLPIQQQQFSNVCPSNRSHLSPMQQLPFDALPEQNPAISCNFIPTHVPFQPLPLNQQQWSQVPLQHLFSHGGPSNQPHLMPKQQQFLNVGPSNQSHLLSKKQFSNVGTSNQPHLQPKQQQFSNVGPSNQPHMLPKQQQQQFSNVGLSNQPHLLPKQQQQFSNVGPSNQPHLLPMQQQQQQFLNDGPSNQPHLQPKQQQQFSNVGPSNQSHLQPAAQQQPHQEEVSGDKAIDYDSILDLDDKFFEDFSSPEFQSWFQDPKQYGESRALRHKSAGKVNSTSTLVTNRGKVMLQRFGMVTDSRQLLARLRGHSFSNAWKQGLLHLVLHLNMDPASQPPPRRYVSQHGP